MMEIFEHGGTMLVSELPQHFRRDKPTLISLELMTEQQTDKLGVDYKKLMSVSLTAKGQAMAKTADEKLQRSYSKSYSKIPA